MGNLLRLLPLVAVLGGCTPSPRDGTGEIGAATAGFTAAFSAGDTGKLADWYTPGAQLLPPNSRFITAREEISFYWEGARAAGAVGLERTTDQAEILGDRAWEVGRYILKNAAGDTLDQGKYLVVWQRVDGAWRLHRDIWNTSRPARVRVTDSTGVPATGVPAPGT